MYRLLPLLLTALLSALAPPAVAQLLGNRFTYQGHLEDGGQPKTGAVDLRFTAFDAETGGALLTEEPLHLEAVPVRNGVFTVTLDFGDALFLGNKVFLAVSVREDADGGAGSGTGFTALAPRQELTPTPYALHAESVSLDAITGSQIANGSITAVDVDTTTPLVGLQRRFHGNCSANQLMQGINQDGTPMCQSAFDVLSDNSYQHRTVGACRGTSAIQVINADGTVVCVQFGQDVPLTPVTLDSVGDVGSHLSMSHSPGSSLAFPSVAYYDATNKRLKFAACNNADCSSPTLRVIDDPSNDVGQYVSYDVINSRASFVYYDATARDLILAMCDNFNCNGGNILYRTLDSGGDVGRFAEIFNISNRVGAAYYDATNNRYKFVLCSDATCSTWNTTTLTGLSGGGVASSDIASARLGQETLPRFAVIDQGTSVVMVSCTTPTCSTLVTRAVSSHSPVGPPLVMTTIPGVAGPRHWVGYGRPGSSSATIHCLDAQCDATSSAGFTVFGSHGGVALAPTPSGLPVGLESSTGIGQLLHLRRFLRAGSTTSSSLAGTHPNGGAVDIAGLSNGGMGIVYYDKTNGDLKYLRCKRDDCSEL